MTLTRPSPTKATPLRAAMMQQMQLHRLSPGTQQLYAKAITDLACYYWRLPYQLTPDDIRAYLHHLLQERELAWSTCTNRCGHPILLHRDARLVTVQA